MLILICGLPGSGKTRVAEEFSKKLKIPILATDKIRKELFLKPKYTNSEKRFVYQVMFLIADELLKNKISVILEAVFPWEDLRKKARLLAKKHKTPFKLIEVKCQEEVLLKRIDSRVEKGSLSDADRKVYFKTKKEFKPIREKHIIINNSKNFKKTKEDIEKILKTFSVA